MIRGRSRRRSTQDIAKEFGIEDPPNAGGGCLVNRSSNFSLRAKDFFSNILKPQQQMILIC